MSNRAAKVISLALDQKNLVDLMSEDKSIFGPVYTDVVDFIGGYSTRYGSSPAISEVNEHFKESLLEPAEGNIKYELEALRDEHVKSELDRMLVTLAKNLDKRPSSEILSKMVERASDLQRLSSRAQDVDITDIDIAVSDMKAARVAKDNGGKGIMTGISAWDNALPMGMLPGHSIMLMGYSGKGKSFLADKIIVEAYKQGKTVLLGSFEMTAEEQRSRIYSILSDGGYYINDLQEGLVAETEIRSWGANNLNSGGRIIVVEQDSHNAMTPAGMQSKIDKFRPDLVVLDYLQLMSDNGRTSKDMVQRMMNLSREIKLLATSNQTAILSITAVTDDDTKKRDSPPRMAQIAWSKQLEYDSDLVVAAHKYEDTPYFELISRKSRRSDSFGMRYEVDFSRGYFREALEDDGE